MIDKWFYISIAAIGISAFIAVATQKYIEGIASVEHSKAGLQQCSERILDEDGDYITTEVLWKKECE